MQPKEYSWSDVEVIAGATTSAYPEPPDTTSSAVTLFYADILTRGFDVIAEYSRLRDRESLAMCGTVGYVLHNMPRIFAARIQGVTGEQGIFYLNGLGVSTWRATVPASYLPVFDSVFMSAPPASETVVYPFELPPAHKQAQYIGRIYQVCQAARHGLRSMSWHPKDEAPPSRELLTPSEVDTALYCSLLAETFQPIPHALLNWSAFDEPLFEQEAKSRQQQIAATYILYWNRIFAKQD